MYFIILLGGIFLVVAYLSKNKIVAFVSVIIFLTGFTNAIYTESFNWMFIALVMSVASIMVAFGDD